MQIESDIAVGRPVSEVFDYIARAECLPDYMTDFESVQQVGEGEPGLGTQYRYRMGRGAEGTFEWTTFEPHSRLAWRGPAVKAGLGSMEPAGWWELSPAAGGGTRVKLVMAPAPGGMFKLLAPLMAAAMRKSNDQALARLKDRLESDPTPPAPPRAPRVS
jgi:uncharacterized membrane protein